MIVELEEGCWLVKGKVEGGSDRANSKKYATRFNTLQQACEALSEARGCRPFPNASIEESFV